MREGALVNKRAGPPDVATSTRKLVYLSGDRIHVLDEAAEPRGDPEPISTMLVSRPAAFPAAEFDRTGTAEYWQRMVKARRLWPRTLELQMETGIAYLLYDNHASRKPKQQNLGTIHNNPCTAVLEYHLTGQRSQHAMHRQRTARFQSSLIY